jgi:hypothetical protein
MPKAITAARQRKIVQIVRKQVITALRAVIALIKRGA